MNRASIAAPLLVAASFAAAPASAEVTAVGDNGFTSTHVHTLAMAPDEAWTLLTGGLPRWWDANHSYGGKADNMALEARPGGCLCETLDGGGWVEHLRVIYLAPGESLKLQGGLGPLVDMGLRGIMNWTLEPNDEGGTTFTSTYRVFGHLDGGFEQLAPVVDQVNGGHFKRLERVAAGLPAEE